MKRSFILLAASLLSAIAINAPVAHATAPSTWTVTAADVNVPDVKPAEAPKAAPAAKRFAVKATAMVGDQLVGEAIYPAKDFDDEAACKAALDGGDADLKAANDGLKDRVENGLPGSKVSFQCVPVE